MVGAEVKEPKINLKDEWDDNFHVLRIFRVFSTIAPLLLDGPEIHLHSAADHEGESDECECRLTGRKR